MKKRITQEREKAGYSRTKLGARSDVHPARVGQIENGRCIPYDPELKRLARALRYEGDPASLLDEVE